MSQLYYNCVFSECHGVGKTNHIYNSVLIFTIPTQRNKATMTLQAIYIRVGGVM